VEAVFAQFLHEAGAVAIGPGWERRSGNDGSRFLKNICDNGRKPLALVVEAAGIF
jgi:hypothetical protein